ncbi:MAG TPA: BON domain-containing protein [Anaerolineales bacterium]|nr:BON domain-containing protein [Anaerolineales bacterium]
MNKSVYNVQHQVQAAFMNDPDVQGYDIEVLDSNGIITLRGNVPTPVARDRAEDIARAVDGVVNVINELDVV